MTKLNSTTVSLHFLFIFLSVFPASAQVLFPVNSNQTQNVFPHLVDTYQSQIQVDSTTLQSHLDSLLNLEDHEPNLAAPAPNIIDMGSTHVEFSWPAISSANSYRIEYINLVTGAASYSTSTLAEIEFNNLNSALYLFSFISLTNTDQSSINSIVVDLQVSLIIVDTEILLQGPSEDELSCDCTPIDSIDTQNQNNIITTSTIPWETTTGNNKYQIDISVSGSNGTYSTSLSFLQEDVGTDPNTYFLSQCDSSYSSVKPYLFGIPDVVEATISNKGIHLYFPMDGLTSYTVHTSLCENSTERAAITEVLPLAKSLSAVQVFPNPVFANQTLHINFTLLQAKPIRIHLFDVLGSRQLSILQKENFDAGYHERYIDTSSLPAGTYYWVLETDEELLSSPFLKME